MGVLESPVFFVRKRVGTLVVSYRANMIKSIDHFWMQELLFNLGGG